jgi:hypothetical protein
MATEKNKASKILSELVDYFLRNKIYQINMSLEYSAKGTIIHLDGPSSKKPEDYDELYEIFNEDRRPEFDEYYYSLLGGDIKRDELNLLGSMINKAEMSYQDNILSITVYRFRE